MGWDKTMSGSIEEFVRRDTIGSIRKIQFGLYNNFQASSDVQFCVFFVSSGERRTAKRANIGKSSRCRAISARKEDTCFCARRHATGRLIRTAMAGDLVRLTLSHQIYIFWEKRWKLHVYRAIVYLASP